MVKVGGLFFLSRDQEEINYDDDDDDEEEEEDDDVFSLKHFFVG